MTIMTITAKTHARHVGFWMGGGGSNWHGVTRCGRGVVVEFAQASVTNDKV